jgi:23S rRNA pseudouridine2605 synthase
MDHAELNRQRAALWLRPVHTLDDAREFLSAVGFCLIYPVRPPLLAPTFIGAVLGTDHDLPTAVKAALDPRTQTANGFVARLLKEKSAFEISYANQGSLLISAAEFPYAFALLGDRNVKQPPSVGLRGEKSLLRHTFEHLQNGPLTEQELLDRLGKSISEAALARALHELWSHLRVLRVDLTADGSPVWQVLYDWAPELVRRGIQISTPEALSALLSRYLTTVIAAETREIEEFFGNLTSRSKVSDVVRALLQAREFESVPIGGKRMITLTGAIPQPGLIPHPPGEAPKDLHEAHKRNELRRHEPVSAPLVRPASAPTARPEGTAERGQLGFDRPKRDLRKSDRSDHGFKPDRQERGSRRSARRESGDAARPRREGSPLDRGLAGGRSERTSKPGFSKSGFSKPGFSKFGPATESPGGPGSARIGSERSGRSGKTQGGTSRTSRRPRSYKHPGGPPGKRSGGRKPQGSDTRRPGNRGPKPGGARP